MRSSHPTGIPVDHFDHQISPCERLYRYMRISLDSEAFGSLNMSRLERCTYITLPQFPESRLFVFNPLPEYIKENRHRAFRAATAGTLSAKIFRAHSLFRHRKRRVSR